MEYSLRDQLINRATPFKSRIQLQEWLRDAMDPDPVSGLGLTLRFPSIPAIVGEILPDSPAERAGFKPGDRLVAVNDVAIADWKAWVEYVRERPGASLQVTLARAGQPLNHTLIPDTVVVNGKDQGKVGMGPQAYEIPDNMLRVYSYSFAGAFVAGLHKTWETTSFVLLSVKKLILGEISTKNLSGPITIAKVAGSSAETGLMSFIGFVALLSVFLAVFNLLPIPVLDGGHLFYYFIEVIKGKPVSDKVQMLGYQVGLFWSLA